MVAYSGVADALANLALAVYWTTIAGLVLMNVIAWSAGNRTFHKVSVLATVVICFAILPLSIPFDPAPIPVDEFDTIELDRFRSARRAAVTGYLLMVGSALNFLLFAWSKRTKHSEDGINTDLT